MQSLSAAEFRAQAGCAALDQLPVPLILVTAASKVVFANEGAERELRAGDAVHLQHGTLACANLAATAQLKSSIDAASRSFGAIGTTFTVKRRSDPRSLAICIAPLGMNDPFTLRYSTSMALVTMIDPEEQVPIDVESLRAAYGLTKAEAEVAIQLAQDKSPDELATLRGVSSATIRTQIRAIIDKTNSDRLMTAIRRMSNLLVRLHYARGSVPLRGLHRFTEDGQFSDTLGVEAQRM